MSNLKVVQTFRLTKRQKTGGKDQPPAVYEPKMQGSLPLVEVMDAKGNPTGTYMVHLEELCLDGQTPFIGVRCFAGVSSYIDAAKYASQHIDGASMTRDDYSKLVTAQAQADAAQRIAEAMAAFDAAEDEADEADDGGAEDDANEQPSA